MTIAADIRAEWDADARALPPETRQRFLDALWAGRSVGEAMRSCTMTMGEAMGVIGMTCDTCTAPAIAVAPGTEPEVCDLFRITRGEPVRAWCARCWPVVRPVAERPA
jgi:hypothetical protein